MCGRDSSRCRPRLWRRRRTPRWCTWHTACRTDCTVRRRSRRHPSRTWRNRSWLCLWSQCRPRWARHLRLRFLPWHRPWTMTWASSQQVPVQEFSSCFFLPEGFPQQKFIKTQGHCVQYVCYPRWPPRYASTSASLLISSSAGASIRTRPSSST